MYYRKTSPSGPWDTIVIGSGMGGMTTAGLLARLGHRVLVLEQHWVPGGFTHTFKRKRWSWDVGVHNVGQVTSHTPVGRLLDALTDNELQWAPLGPVYEEFNYPDGFTIEFPDDPHQFREALYTAFPFDRNAIDGYFAKVREVAAAVQGYYLSRLLPRRLSPLTDRFIGGDGIRCCGLRTSDVIGSLTSNERLRAVLTSQWGYHGSPPSRSSFTIHAMVAHSFRYGGYYPRGGPKRIAETLLQPVVERGGAVRIRADVEQILVERGRAIGVRLTDGEEIRASHVVSAAGALTTVNRFLPAEQREQEWARSFGRLPPAPAHVALHLGFKGDVRSAGAGAANEWYYETWDTRCETWEIERPEAKAPALYVSYNTLKDPEHDPGPEQLHTGMVITFIPWERFSRWADSGWKKRGADYEDLKAELSQRLLAQFAEHVPALEPMIDYTELSTPLSTEFFTRAARGSIYGLEPTPERFANPWLRPRLPLKGLYLSGCDAGLPGVIGAMLGGVLAAVAIEPRRAIQYIRKL